MTEPEHPAGERDRAFIRRALALAERGWGQTAPNPMVGAVVVRGDTVVAEGWHARYGEPHAEVAALARAGDAARGATLYVTLEPCAHHGKTPPCADAIVTAGVSRVVIATPDPNPEAAGGAARLRAAGIDVTLGVEEAAARELNAAFFFAHAADRPWVTLKLAISIDGALTDARRASAWLTGPESRAEVHRMRAGSDAIAVGVGTVLADDPLLTVRGALQPRVQPAKVVFDDRLETPPKAKLFAPGAAGQASIAANRQEPRVFVVSTAPEAVPSSRAAPLEEAGAELVLAGSTADALRALRAGGVRSLLVEGGAGLAGRLLEAGAVDRLVIFQAPIVLGQGAVNAFARAPAELVADATRLAVVDRRAFGDDLRTVYALTPL